MRAGEPDGIVAAGRAAFASLRLEKGYRLWGVDMSAEDDPWEAGLGWVVKRDKGDFVGRAALEGRSDATARRRLLPLVMDDPTHVVLGKEPVFVAGRPAGYVTSAAMGHTSSRAVRTARPSRRGDAGWLLSQWLNGASSQATHSVPTAVAQNA